MGALWETEVFAPGQVRVEAALQEVAREDFAAVEGAKFYFLVWSVTRL